MKAKSIFIALFLLQSQLHAQTKWDKNATTALEDECIAYLSKNYKQLDENSKETISLCFSKEMKLKYPSREDYTSLSDRELNRIKNTYILQCAKTSLGIELRVPEVKLEEKPNKDNLIGHWQDDESDFYLNPDGMVSITFNDDNNKEKGTWTIEGDILTLKINRRSFGKKEKVYQIFDFTKDKFLYQSQKTMKNQTVKRVI